jgi:hypothetical protein
MMKPNKKLSLTKETIRSLTQAEMGHAVGGSLQLNPSGLQCGIIIVNPRPPTGPIPIGTSTTGGLTL